MQISDSSEKELTRAKNAAYRLLTYRPRSRVELALKLREKKFDEPIIEAVLADLERFGYVNDREFTRQWALSRVRLCGFGRRRIEQELKTKGIDREIIRQTFAEVFLDDTEIETAKQAAAKKLNTMKGLDRDVRRRRLAGFLERKGYSFDVIRAVLRES